MPAVSSTASRSVCGTSSSGWTPAAAEGSRRQTCDRWSSSTSRKLARLPGVDRAVPGRVGAGRRRRGSRRPARPAGHRSRRRGRPPHPGRRVRPAPGWRPGATVTSRPRTRLLRVRRGAAAGRAHLPTSSAARSRWPTSASRKAGSATRSRTYERALQLRRIPTSRRRCCAARRTCTSAEPDRPRAQRPGRRDRAPHAQPGARRARRAAAEPLSLARRDGPGPGSPRGTWPARSNCSTRRSGCTPATSPRTCGRCPRCAPACWPPTGRWTKPSSWARGARACPPTTT